LGLAHRGSVDSGDAHRDRPADHRGRRRLTTTPDRLRRPGRRRPGYRRRSGGPRPGTLGSPDPSSSASTPTPRRWPSRRGARRGAGPANVPLRRRRCLSGLPAELSSLADELTIVFPWGSLLRGTLALDDAAAASAGIASLLAPGGVATAFVSIEDRDGLELPRLDADGACESLRERWSRHGLELCTLRPATGCRARARPARPGPGDSRRVATGSRGGSSCARSVDPKPRCVTLSGPRR
jgi:hypothetical protein